MSDFCYRQADGAYVLYCDDEAIGDPFAEVSLGFDRDSGTLHRHGDPVQVQSWFVAYTGELRAAGHAAMAERIVTLTGRFELEELNKCLQITGYVSRMYSRLMATDPVCAPAAKAMA